MRNTNKASQQRMELSCQCAAAVQGSLLCMGRWVYQAPASLQRGPQRFSSKVKARQGRGAGSSVEVTALGKGQGTYRDTAGGWPGAPGSPCSAWDALG